MAASWRRRAAETRTHGAICRDATPRSEEGRRGLRSRQTGLRPPRGARATSKYPTQLIPTPRTHTPGTTPMRRPSAAKQSSTYESASKCENTERRQFDVRRFRKADVGSWPTVSCCDGPDPRAVRIVRGTYSKRLLSSRGLLVRDVRARNR